MTQWNDVKDDQNYIKVLDHGFVGFVDKMGTDDDIAQSARVSYGKGTKTVNENTQLIRYLYNHEHMSPFEMCEMKFHVKMPIFVARQWIRHRMANVNEYSARYSIMSREYYNPDILHIQPQSSQNHQGRGGEFTEETATHYLTVLDESAKASFDAYDQLLAGYNSEDGVAREIARNVLPTNTYTEMYWKCDIRNLLHFLKLRMDSHAQYEIREYANTIAQFVEQYFPVTFRAFEDYSLHAKKLTRMDVELLKKIFDDHGIDVSKYIAEQSGDEPLAFAKSLGMTKRELGEFIQKFEI